jgi:hypothetical protein
VIKLCIHPTCKMRDICRRADVDNELSFKGYKTFSVNADGKCQHLILRNRRSNNDGTTYL